MVSFKQYQTNPSKLRQKCLKYRNQISSENMRYQFSRIIKRLNSFLPFQQSTHILAYYGKESSGEFNTRPLLDTILEQKQLYLPKSVIESISLEIYQVRSIQDDISLGLYGIMEPIRQRCVSASVDQIDLIIVPGSVFDRTGGRYGFGAGYYDSFLKDFTGLKVALALDALVMDFDLHLHPRDIKMDYIITEKAIYPNIKPE